MAEIIQVGEATDVITAYRQIPYAVISEDVPEYLRNGFYTELSEIMKYYDIYHNGAEFPVEGTNADYEGSTVRYKKCKTLIDKEARFLFASSPDFYINRNASGDKEKEQASNISDYLQAVMESTNFKDKLVKAARDCFIGKRVGCMVNFSDSDGISITFLKSYEFIYEKDASENLVRFIAFYTVVDATDKRYKRILKKSYQLKNGACYVTEGLYDGAGNLVEQKLKDHRTLFDYIPAVVILNDGLSNDGDGESDIQNLDQYEILYSRLANADVDTERKSMNPVTYTMDVDEESTKKLSRAPGAYWDLKSNPITPDPKTGQVGTLESGMNYSSPLKVTLERVETQMYSQLDVPNTSNEQLQGMITSGKTLKALYWGLMVRCDEKMLTWAPALVKVTRILIEGARLYPIAASKYVKEVIQYDNLDIEVENNYPILDDESEEKAMDLAEVQAMTMSRKAYMMKWRRLTDEEAEGELQQILIEKQIFEDSYIPTDWAEDKDSPFYGANLELETGEVGDSLPNDENHENGLSGASEGDIQQAAQETTGQRLSGVQVNGLMTIMERYSDGRVSEQQAITLIRRILGCTQDEARSFLTGVEVVSEEAV